MKAILGIDAAWTPGQPSGVALIQARDGRSRVLCVAPSYRAFINAGRGEPVDWQSPQFGGDEPDIAELLQAAGSYGVKQVDLIALDIPLAHTEVSSRRISDSAVSKTFGGKGCSTHSPTATRPGPVSKRFQSQLKEAGYVLTTTAPGSAAALSAIEVYPHPALLSLLNAPYRIPYKVSRSGQYWRGESIQQRISNLCGQFSHIYTALQANLGDLGFELPAQADVRSLSYLKRYEDALDALICAWVGHQHLLGLTRPYGDHESAIWVPEPV